MGDRFKNFVKPGIDLVEVSGEKMDLPHEIIAAAKEFSASEGIKASPVLDINFK